MLENFLSILSIAAIVAFFGFFFFLKRRETGDWIYIVYFFTVFLSGIALYTAGYAYEVGITEGLPPLYVLQKALSSVVVSFWGEYYPETIARLSAESPLYTVAVFVNYLACILFTFLVAVKLFGKNAVNRVRVFFRSFRNKFIIVGSAGQAEIFLNNLVRKQRRRTIVVLEPCHNDAKKELMYAGFAVAVVKEESEKAHKAENGEKDAAKEMREALIKAGLKRNWRGTKIIAMSERDETNLLTAKIVTDYISGEVKPRRGKSGRIEPLSKSQEKFLESLKLTAHIMYGFLDRAEHFAFTEYALGRVIFFNPFELRARKFILENPITSLIPARWINTAKARLYNPSDDEAHKKLSIGNIFVGFGSISRNILKKSICTYQLLGVDYNALVIDKDVKIMKKQFRALAPGLFDKYESGRVISRGAELKPDPDGQIYYPSPDECNKIDFFEANVLSEEFYQRAVAEAGAHDFTSIIVSLGDDKTGVETALELRRKLYEYGLLWGGDGGEKYDRVKIFVRVKKDSVLSDRSLLNDKNDIDNEISIFGSDGEILTENYIVQEELDIIAKRVANGYWKAATRDSGGKARKFNGITKWGALTDFKRDSNRNAVLGIRYKLNLLGFDLKKGEGGTDAKTVKAYESAYGMAAAKRQRAEKETGKFVDFLERDTDGNIIDNARNNLARLEHQRWNVFYLTNGWTKLEKARVTADTRQDEKAKQHACITTLEGLSALSRKQAELAAAAARISGEELSLDKALSAADTVCYDFDVMDGLFANLEDSNYIVTRRHCEE